MREGVPRVLGQRDASRWPAEYCGAFRNVSLSFAARSARGPEGIAARWGVPLLALAALGASTCVTGRAVLRMDPVLAAQLWRLPRWLPWVTCAVFCLTVLVFPRAAAVELRIIMRVTLRLLPVLLCIGGVAVALRLFVLHRPQRRGNGDPPVGGDRPLRWGDMMRRTGMKRLGTSSLRSSAARCANSPGRTPCSSHAATRCAGGAQRGSTPVLSVVGGCRSACNSTPDAGMHSRVPNGCCLLYSTPW